MRCSFWKACVYVSWFIIVIKPRYRKIGCCWWILHIAVLLDGFELKLRFVGIHPNDVAAACRKAASKCLWLAKSNARHANNASCCMIALQMRRHWSQGWAATTTAIKLSCTSGLRQANQPNRVLQWGTKAQNLKSCISFQCLKFRFRWSRLVGCSCVCRANLTSLFFLVFIPGGLTRGSREQA